MKCSRVEVLFLTLLVFCGVIHSGSAPEKKPPGELNKAHLHLQSTESCSSCHNSEFEVESGKCLACHQGISNRIKLLTGYHVDKNEECHLCHPEHRGKNSILIEFEWKDFDHNETGFRIDGAHKKIPNCRKCHTGQNAVKRKFFNSFLLQSRHCSACHKDPHNSLYPNCENCHSTKDWSVDIWKP